MSSVKTTKGAEKGPVSERLARVLDAFSPWAGISLTYRQFAAEIGPPVTEAAIKKWPQRKKFPADVARMIVTRARERGVEGLSHNELGQWSSAEVQHTVIWALKDLGRRLRVLQFDMGETFELTDGWAGEVDLPCGPKAPPSTHPPISAPRS